MNTKDYKPVFFIQNLDTLTARLSTSRKRGEREKVIREFKSEFEANNCLAQFNSYKRVIASILQNLVFYEKAFSFPEHRGIVYEAYLTIYRDGEKIVDSSLQPRHLFESFVMEYYKPGYRILTSLRVVDNINYIDIYLNR